MQTLQRPKRLEKGLRANVIGSYDFHQTYKALGGKLGRDKFLAPYNEMIKGFIETMIIDDITIRTPYVNIEFRPAMVKVNRSMYFDYEAAWKIWNEMWPDKTNAEILKIKRKPMVFKKPQDSLVLKTNRKRTHLRFIGLKLKFYDFNYSTYVKKILHQQRLKKVTYLY